MRRHLLALLCAAATGGCAFDLFDAEAMSRGDARLSPLPPPSAVGPNPTGLQPLGLASPRDGSILVPASYDATRAWPLLVLLHGAGGSAAQILATHERLADSIGVIVLAIDSRAFTWDAVLARFDYDLDFLDAALASTVARYRVDRTRIGIGGFSDGASWAMAVGLANGDLFDAVILHSPGVRWRVRLVGTPRFFVAHGTEDEVLPHLATREFFVPFLRVTGHEVRYVEWPGPHAMSLANIRASLDWLAHGD